MRKITDEAQEAFWDNRYFKQDNTTVLNGTLSLHGYTIAIYHDNKLTMSSYGYRTNVTKERLNGVLSRLGFVIKSKRGEWSIYNRNTNESFLFVDGIQLRLGE